MNFDLLVPNLFWPAAAGAEPYRDLELPALQALMSRGQRARGGGSSAERWLAAVYGLPDALPLAPFALRGDGGEPGDGAWLCADPVHLKVHGDRLILADTSHFSITADEARELTAALNAHFAADGVKFLAPVPQRWYLELKEEPQLRSTPTAEMAGRSIEPFMPAGGDAARWRRFFNEAQMVLHAHPLNAERALPVNSIWLWGAGKLQPVNATYDAVWADHPAAAGLAAASGAARYALPATADAVLKNAAHKTPLAVTPLPATAYGDLAGWRDALLALEQAWFAPLLAALKSGAMETLTLHALGPDHGYAATATRRDLWCLWRVKRPLQTYAA